MHSDSSDLTYPPCWATHRYYFRKGMPIPKKQFKIAAEMQQHPPCCISAAKSPVFGNVIEIIRYFINATLQSAAILQNIEVL